MKRIASFLLALIMLLATVQFASAETLIYSKVTPAEGATAALRVLPGDSRPVIQDVPSGSQIKVLYEGSTWHKVEVVRGGKIGWMRDEDITLGSRGMSATDFGSVLEKNAYVNLASSDYASLRWGPETYYDEIAQMRGGSSLWIYETVGNWYRVRTTEGLVGYVSKSLIKTTSEYIEFGDDAYGFVQVSGNSAGFRKGLANGTGNYDSLRSGEVVQILAREENYYLVVANDGREGYVYYNLISVGGMNKTRYEAELYYDATTYTDVIRTTPARQTVKVLATDGYFSRVEYDEHIGYILNAELINNR